MHLFFLVQCPSKYGSTERDPLTDEVNNCFVFKDSLDSTLQGFTSFWEIRNPEALLSSSRSAVLPSIVFWCGVIIV